MARQSQLIAKGYCKSLVCRHSVRENISIYPNFCRFLMHSFDFRYVPFSLTPFLRNILKFRLVSSILRKPVQMSAIWCKQQQNNTHPPPSKTRRQKSLFLPGRVCVLFRGRGLGGVIVGGLFYMVDVGLVTYFYGILDPTFLWYQYLWFGQIMSLNTPHMLTHATRPAVLVYWWTGGYPVC